MRAREVSQKATGQKQGCVAPKGLTSEPVNLRTAKPKPKRASSDVIGLQAVLFFCSIDTSEVKVLSASSTLVWDLESVGLGLRIVLAREVFSRA